MNSIDHDYISTLMMERMSYHVEQNSEKDTDSFKRFCQLGEQLNDILNSLPAEQAEVIREHEQNSYERNCRKHDPFYRSGFLDGFKLAVFLHELTR